MILPGEAAARAAATEARSMLLQLALDFPSLGESLALLDRVADLVDIVEVGTPLILKEGVRAVAEVKRRHPGLQVLADLKVMDAGELEAAIGFEAGADIVTVLGAAETVTIERVCVAARRETERRALVREPHASVREPHALVREPHASVREPHASVREPHASVRVMVDLIAVQDVSRRAAEIAPLGPDYLCCHAAYDAQAAGGDPLADLARLRAAPGGSGLRLAVAGGITPERIAALRAHAPEIIIVGGYVARAADPRAAARAVWDAIHRA
jgi:3-hexulose-6-phosphate synthase